MFTNLQLDVRIGDMFRLATAIVITFAAVFGVSAQQRPLLTDDVDIVPHKQRVQLEKRVKEVQGKANH